MSSWPRLASLVCAMVAMGDIINLLKAYQEGHRIKEGEGLLREAEVLR